MDGITAGLVFEETDLLDQSMGSISTSASLAFSPALEGHVQHTLRNPISCSGIGLHGGARVQVTFLPAAPDTGIVFRRTDLGSDDAPVEATALFDHVIDTRLCTVIAPAERPEARVGTIEHLMAALAACGIDNLIVGVNGPELPVLDGSSAPFLFLIDCADRLRQDAPRRVIEVLKRVRVEDARGGFAELRPARAAGLSMSLCIEFDADAIGRQAYTMHLTEQAFRDELADCRTFTTMGEIEAMRAAGLARGGSLDNAVVVDGAAVLNPAGLRRPDEFVRHKMLDAIGDLALAGRPLQGAFTGHRSGHALNNRLLHALLADRSAWRLSDCRMPARRAA